MGQFYWPKGGQNYWPLTAIRPFAVGRRNWLFADTPRGAKASATVYSLIETAKANGLEPFAYLHHVLQHIGGASTVEEIEALLPWNVTLSKLQEASVLEPHLAILFPISYYLDILYISYLFTFPSVTFEWYQL